MSTATMTKTATSGDAEAVHLCIMMRGVEKQHARTITAAWRGAFLDDPALRDEFLVSVQRGFAPRRGRRHSRPNRPNHVIAFR